MKPLLVVCEKQSKCLKIKFLRKHRNKHHPSIYKEKQTKKWFANKLNKSLGRIYAYLALFITLLVLKN